jgi:hypothetical protein
MMEQTNHGLIHEDYYDLNKVICINISSLCSVRVSYLRVLPQC